MYPIAMATARSLGLDPMPFLMALLVAASCGFATPIGYQTNLMVQGPGGYRFGDYLRVGLALDLVVMGTALVVVPLVWPLVPST
jgi:di/tricarboxylate transporter